MLVEDYLVAVVSLPAGVFNPYSGVKTSILILDKSLAKKSEHHRLLQGRERRLRPRRPAARDRQERPAAGPAEIGEYLRRLRAGESVEDFQPTLGLIVEKEKIAANGDYNLSGERYREGSAETSRISATFRSEKSATINPEDAKFNRVVLPERRIFRLIACYTE